MGIHLYIFVLALCDYCVSYTTIIIWKQKKNSFLAVFSCGWNIAASKQHMLMWQKYVSNSQQRNIRCTVMALGLAFVHHGECLGFPVHCWAVDTKQTKSLVDIMLLLVSPQQWYKNSLQWKWYYIILYMMLYPVPIFFIPLIPHFTILTMTSHMIVSVLSLLINEIVGLWTAIGCNILAGHGLKSCMQYCMPDVKSSWKSNCW